MLCLYPTTLVKCPSKSLDYLAGHSLDKRVLTRFRRKFSRTLISLMHFAAQGRPSTLHLLLGDSIEDLEKAREKAVRSSSIRASLKGVGESTLKLAMSAAKSFGLLFTFRTLTKGPFILSTELGSKLYTILSSSSVSKELDELSRCQLLLVPGLIFPTKAKLITISVLSLREGHVRDIHNSLLQNFEAFSSVQKLVVEILYEIRMMNTPKRPSTKREAYYTETEVILALLEMMGIIETKDDFKYFSIIDRDRTFLNARDVVGLFRYFDESTFGYQFSIEPTLISELRSLGAVYQNLLDVLEVLRERKREIIIDLENPYRVSNL